MQMLKTVIWMRKAIVALGFFCVFAKIDFEIVRLRDRSEKSRKSFLMDFQEAANFENSENWREDWIGQPRSSQPEVDFQDFRDSGEPGAGPEEDFKGFWKSFEGI